MRRKYVIAVGIVFLAFLMWRLIVLFSGGTGGRSDRSGRPPVIVISEVVISNPEPDSAVKGPPAGSS